MINLRAGLVYNISNGKLNKQHMNEIFYWSNNHKFITLLKMIDEILTIDPNINYNSPIDFDASFYFGEFYEMIKIYLNDVGENVLSYYFLEYCRFETITNPITVWNKNTVGQKQEKIAIFKFNNVYGYRIGEAKRGNYLIEEHGLLISGTPDGVVLSSPGGIFDDHIVEIKCQNRINDECKTRNKYQIACYCKIFNKPVLLIIYNCGQYLIYRFTLESLNRFWNSQVLPKLIKGINPFKKFIKVKSLTDFKQYESFINGLS